MNTVINAKELRSVERTDLSFTVSRPREFDLMLKGSRQQRYRVGDLGDQGLLQALGGG